MKVNLYTHSIQHADFLYVFSMRYCLHLNLVQKQQLHSVKHYAPNVLLICKSQWKTSQAIFIKICYIFKGYKLNIEIRAWPLTQRSIHSTLHIYHDEQEWKVVKSFILFNESWTVQRNWMIELSTYEYDIHSSMF